MGDNDDTVTQFGGNYIVPMAKMEYFYYDIFGTTDIPNVPDNLADSISYDEANNSYSVIGASGEGLSYVVSSIVIGKRFN